MKNLFFIVLLLLVYGLFQNVLSNSDFFYNDETEKSNEYCKNQCVDNNCKSPESFLDIEIYDICVEKCKDSCKNETTYASKEEYKSTLLTKIKYSTKSSKISENKMAILNYLEYAQPLTSDQTLFSNIFVSKFTQPFLAIQLPNDVTINEDFITVNFNYFEAPDNMNLQEVLDNLGITFDFNWISKNCTRKAFELEIDNSQDSRILKVFNILHPVKKNYHWEIIKVKLPDNLIPAKNVFLKTNISFYYELNIKDLPFDITYIVSFGKVTSPPIIDTIFNAIDVNEKKPDLLFTGEFGDSKSGIHGIYHDNKPVRTNWLCNCSDKDKKVNLNASISEWNINDFFFYHTSGSIENNDFKIGDKIGDNGVAITIPKPFDGEKEGINYPNGFYSSCNCFKVLTASETKYGTHNQPAVFKITAQDTQDESILSEATIALFEASNTIYPILNVNNDGTNLKLSWFAPFATKYILYYLPVGATKVSQYELGTMESAVLPSESIKPLYIAIQACYENGKCDLSNIETTH